MDTVEQVLTDIAREAVDAAEEAAQLRDQLEFTEVECSAVRLAARRLPSFSARVGEEYLCPRRYIANGIGSPLRSVMCTRDEIGERRRSGRPTAVRVQDDASLPEI